MTQASIPELVSCIAPDSIRVHAPSSVIFICGGKVDVESSHPKSLRDAFLRYAYSDGAISKYNLIEAESLNSFFPKKEYSDLLKFESDLALISDLILLFSESFGSAAELGAFANISQISDRLLLVIDDKNYNENSFVKLGPVLSLENNYGESAVCVLNRRDIKIESIKDVSNIDMNTFKLNLNASIESRMKIIPNHSKFSKNNEGHIIKLIVGVIQHYGALTVDEIEVYLYCLDIGVSRERIIQFLLVAEFVKWIKKSKRGVTVYYSATSLRVAMSYKLKPNSGIVDKFRWQSDIQDKWKIEEPLRFASIQEAVQVVG